MQKILSGLSNTRKSDAMMKADADTKFSILVCRGSIFLLYQYFSANYIEPFFHRKYFHLFLNLWLLNLNTTIPEKKAA